MNRDLVWKAMYEADVHRRYYEEAYTRLSRQNRAILWVTWLASATAAVTSLLGPPVIAGALVVGAAFVTTLREILRIPERMAKARCIRMAAGIEFDRMSLLWDSNGDHQPVPEYESRRVISQFQDSDTEALDRERLRLSVGQAVEHLKGLGATHG